MINRIALTTPLNRFKPLIRQGKNYSANKALGWALELFALNYNQRANLNNHLFTKDGPIKATVVWQSEDEAVSHTIQINNGRIKVTPGAVQNADCYWVFKDRNAIAALLSKPPSEVLLMLLKSDMQIRGSLSVSSMLNYLLARLLDPIHHWRNKKENKSKPQIGLEPPVSASKKQGALVGKKSDKVQFLNDPYLKEFTLARFPRLTKLLHQHFMTTPQICTERPRLITDWYRQHGFETRANQKPWIPAERQGLAYQYLMTNKKPIISADDLLAGTTTTHDIGVVLYPDAHGTLIWGELTTISERKHNPYKISAQDIELLHKEVFPFWMKRNFREWVRSTYGETESVSLESKFAAYFCWKTVALSHTVVDIPTILKVGTEGVINKIRQQINQSNSHAGVVELTAMMRCLDGVEHYAQALAVEAAIQSQQANSAKRSRELNQMAQACRRVPRKPPRNIFEALQSIWIMWIALHMENTNAGLSLGRMDQWLQPFLVNDIAKINSKEKKQEYIAQVIEWVGCFYLRCADHLPLVPDIGNYLFGGSSSDQAITLGGVDAQGETAVNDMTFIFLKVTEMLAIRDPNINARYDPAVNSDNYLQRLCEVNLVTGATPSIHGDNNVIQSLVHSGYSLQDSRDWSAVGCVEPTLSGQHMSHTGCIMFNMVAALEMALDNGHHDLMRQKVGLSTGEISKDEFKSFESFYAAFLKQLTYLAEQATEYNNQLGYAHQALRPTPLLSALLNGCIENEMDATQGGANFNSSGVACIGLADVVDSLLVIQEAVFEQGWLSFSELYNAVKANYKGYEKELMLINKRIPKFGSGDLKALSLAKRFVADVYAIFAKLKHYRNGYYAVGFWSMSNHVAFGNLSGALPSGRLANKAFTPGLTPVTHASKNLLDNLIDVAALPANYMPNNVAFNVKYIPAETDSRQCAVNQMSAYVKTYCQQGGMQVQFNVVSSETLKDAMAHPENYRDLLVRISGYNAYFVTLNPEMQKELIERTEFCAP